ncbi:MULTISPECIES: DUF6515 family protein [Pseudomonas]|jgi:hypothetical protein|uniref:DUF6515 family protein n=1 Tax=Pseudomonas TaxID=286 RepID=UPI000D6C690E|nr:MULTISPECIES: DUF6515 family protein [Pseudomonas]AXP05415.1 glycine zipper family protein [Pseudomonas fluorescens]PWJ29189.1 hypothetical protein ATJ40_11956 [Pseudomonas sp. 43mfcvi1.1]QIB06615.1 glycine zipper family protein [Pseudomonas fluorescens]UQI30465.1 glycine zipper family protein [Pseudomonas bijieensis]WLH62223.1 glycine zipper family protein [Pseudomonas sp. FP2300]
MKSRIWRLAGVGLLWASVSAQGMADDQQNRGGPDGGRGQDGRGGNGQGYSGQPRPQSNEIIRGDNSRQFEVKPQPPYQGGQHYDRGPQDPNGHGRPQPQPGNNLPIQGRPDSVTQTREPQPGYYRDIPRRNDGYPNAGPRPDHDGRPDQHWPGRPGGHGNGWGPGPQYRPGYVIDRFPDRNYRVPYRGQDYFYSGGYWYRPQGPRYVVVQPPRGIRTRYLPDYAREVWIGSSLFFLAAGAYYIYEANTQDYVVVEPPVANPQPQPQGNSFDVVAYPANGQSPEQVNQDGYDCYRWAVQQSGFDPRNYTYPPAPEVVQTYRQAQGSCLSSRGYQVTY